MPAEVFGEAYEFLPKPDLLSFEEIERVARAAAGLGVRKLRLTGGEPLLRADLPKLVGLLAAIDGIEDLSLTTNGSLLAGWAGALRDAGLDRVTVSLDSLDEEVLKKMSGRKHGVAPVFAGIEAAERVGLAPIKINCVAQRGVNDHTFVDLARYFRGTGHIVRFIEFMDVGTLNGWDKSQVIEAQQIHDLIAAAFPLEPVEPNYPGETARRYRYRDGAGEIGIIASVTQPFCGGCTRARLTPEGRLFTCLFGSEGADLRTRLRDGAADGELREFLAGVWGARTDRYSDDRTEHTERRERIEMFRIGG